MFTVVRFNCKKKMRPSLDKIGKAMNMVKPGIYKGLNSDNPRGGFVCDVFVDSKGSVKGVWGIHRNEIMRFVADFRRLISQMTKIGGSVHFDTAFYPNDSK